MQTIADRMKWIIGNWLPERKRFTILEKLSGIPSGHWKNFWHGKQRAHEHMIQALARQWPEYALWLVTGIDDPESGQQTPTDKLPSPETRTTSGRLLARKVFLDEGLNSTQSLAALNDPMLKSLRTPDQEEGILHAYADNLSAVVLTNLRTTTEGELDKAEIVKTDEELLSLLQKRAEERGH